MKLVFERWRNNPQVQEASEKFSAAADRFLSVRDSSETDDRIAARRFWSDLSSMYWTVTVALVDAQTETLPDELVFDEQERLFLDFGVVDQELTPFHPELPGLLNSRAPAGLFQYYSFSDHIAECYSMVMAKPVTPPRSGFSIEEKQVQLGRQLDALKTRTKVILPVVLSKVGVTSSEAESILSDLHRCLDTYTEVQMRTRKYREAEEKERQQMAVRNHAFIEAEKRIASALKGNGEEAGLDENEIAKVTKLLESAKTLARNIVYVGQELVKWDRKVKKKAADLEAEAPAFRRRELRNMIEANKEYISLTAKSARLDDSRICQSDRLPFAIEKAAAILEEMIALDPEMLVVARVRMYGIPRVILVPGQGYGTYDWNDHTLLIPAFPSYSPERAAAYALGTFRWDSDEDRVIKNSYELIKENRDKSILDLNTSFYKDYFLWLTKEKKGYRILPRNTHKVFIQMFAPQKQE